MGGGGGEPCGRERGRGHGAEESGPDGFHECTWCPHATHRRACAIPFGMLGNASKAVESGTPTEPPVTRRPPMQPLDPNSSLPHGICIET